MSPNNTEGAKKRKSPGIRVHLFAYMMIFLLILLGLLWLFQVVFFEEIYKFVKIGENTVYVKTGRYEVVSKADLYSNYHAFLTFFKYEKKD